MDNLPGRVRVYIACSLDGFIADVHDGLDWLTQPRADHGPLASGNWAERPADALQYDDFFRDVGCLLMGRRTYDVVSTFDEWPYGDTPVIVATSRPLDDAPPTVTTASAPIKNLIAEAHDAAGEKDVYLDGGNLIRQALDADQIDQIIVTQMPTVLGRGHPLFAGADNPRELTVTDVLKFEDGMVQLHLMPVHDVAK
ncbi:dihydrofolate reductase family protein [Demequina aurantiaca]|uniref:dihydrofolate reductase family protein n=1 Tax=Demequina aurantiaca TaxID=676200 RepID=UPI000781F2B9|nr:dihydrofolate reductase family protein [Demequina aurantiaca]